MKNANATKTAAKTPICYHCGKDILNTSALTCKGKDGTMRWCIPSSLTPVARKGR